MDNYPNTVIVGVADIIDKFNNSVFGLICDDDLAELMTQIIQLLLNNNQEIVDYNVPFPDFTRFKNTEFLKEENTYLNISYAILILHLEINNRLIDSGVYFNDEDEFDYFFDRFIGKDIVLKCLPY
jgi:hypothetical protein